MFMWSKLFLLRTWRISDHSTHRISIECLFFTALLYFQVLFMFLKSSEIEPLWNHLFMLVDSDKNTFPRKHMNGGIEMCLPHSVCVFFRSYVNGLLWTERKANLCNKTFIFTLMCNVITKKVKRKGRENKLNFSMSIQFIAVVANEADSRRKTLFIFIV